jgi:hypothetical protein
MRKEGIAHQLSENSLTSLGGAVYGERIDDQPCTVRCPQTYLRKSSKICPIHRFCRSRIRLT